MAKYVVAAGGNSNASGTWSNVSSASPGGDGVPAATDDCFADAGSGQLTVNAAFPARSLNCTGYTGTLTRTAAFTATLGDGTAGASNVALKLVAAMTLTNGSTTSSAWSFISTSATQQTIACGGKVLGNFTISCASNGNYILSDGLSVNGATSTTITLGGCTLFNLNGQAVAFGLFDLSSTGSSRTLTCGAAALSSVNTGSAWNAASPSGLTLNADTSTITLNGTGGASLQGGGLTYNNLVMSGSATARIVGTNTFNTITRTGTASKLCELQLDNNQTCTTFVVNSNSDINRVLVRSGTLGTSRTITAGTYTATNIVDFKDITGAGAATWTVAGSGATALGDCGGNSGITFTTPATQTATGTASFTWSTHGWTSRVPLPQDDVVVNNSFIGGRTVTMDMPRAGKSLTFGCTNTPTFTPNVAWSLFGSLNLTGIGSISGTSALTLEGRGSYTITTGAISFATVPIVINAIGGTYTQADALTMGAATIDFTNGNYNANGFNFTNAAQVRFSGNLASRTITMGSGTWTLSGVGTIWNIGVTTGLTFVTTGSTLAVTNTSATSKLVSAAGFTYNNFTCSGDNVTLASSNTFTGTFRVNTSGLTTGLLVANGTTQTVNAVATNGTSGSKALMWSSSAGSAFNLSCPNPVDVDGMSIKDCTAAGNTPFYATNSTNVSGNTNWIFGLRPLPFKPVIASTAITRAACF